MATLVIVALAWLGCGSVVVWFLGRVFKSGERWDEYGRHLAEIEAPGAGAAKADAAVLEPAA